MDEFEQLEAALAIALEDGSKNQRVARVDRLLETGVFTHRLTSEEVESNSIPVWPDLGFFTDPDVADLPVELSTGGVLDVVTFHSGPHVVGPDGWLSAGSVGEYVAIRRGSGIEVSFLGRTELESGHDEQDAVARFVAEHRRDGLGVDLVAMLLDLIADRVGTDEAPLFASAIPPLGELLGNVGLVERDGEAAPRDAQWFSARQKHLARRIETAAQTYDFDSCCQKAFDRVWDAYQELGDATAIDATAIDRTPIDGTAIGRDLVHGDVARAFAEVALGRSTEADAGLAALVNTVLASSDDGESQAAALYLAGLQAERVPDARLAEKLLQEAVEKSFEFLPAREELAYYVLDRGDLDGAIRLLQDDRYLPDGFLQSLTDLRDDLRRPFASIGRNDRCPCGSGRKFKACCLRDPKPGLDERLVMIDAKTSLFSFRPHRRLAVELISDLIENRPESLSELIGLEAVQIEGGLLVDYLAERGDLLPPEERGLIDEMIRRGRRLGRLVRGDASTIEIELLPDGERITVPNDFDAAPPIGEAMFFRPITTAGGNMIVGLPLKVDAELVDEALEMLSTAASGHVFLDWVVHAPDRLPARNEAGEALVLCSVTYEVDGIIDELRAWLDDTCSVDDANSWCLDDAEGHPDPVMLRIVHENGLDVGAMTQRQFEEVRSLIAERFGALTVRSESVKPLVRGHLRDLQEDAEVGDQPWAGESGDPADDPLTLW